MNCDSSNDPDRHLLDESARRKICEAWQEADRFWRMWFRGGILTNFWRTRRAGWRLHMNDGQSSGSAAGGDNPFAQMPRRQRGHQGRKNNPDSGVKSYIGRCKYFFKDHVVGIFIGSVAASLIASFIYAVLVPSEPKPTPRFCTFSSRSEKDITEGTVFSVGYGENLKLRGDYTTVYGDKKKKVHLLVRSMTAYVWWNDENEGIKFPLVRMPFAEQLFKLVNKDQLTDEEGFKCKNWKPDSSKMDFPTNVNFIDIEKENNSLVPKLPPPITEISSDARYCSASIPSMDGITHGTLYFGDGDKLRVDLVTSSNKERHIIFNTKMAYFWNAPQNTGIKFPVKGRPSDALLSPTAKVECQKWAPDDSVFVPPEHVSFKEASGEDVVWYLEDFSRP